MINVAAIRPHEWGNSYFHTSLALERHGSSFTDYEGFVAKKYTIV
jgi:hypothetical protein